MGTIIETLQNPFTLSKYIFFADMRNVNFTFMIYMYITQFGSGANRYNTVVSRWNLSAWYWIFFAIIFAAFKEKPTGLIQASMPAVASNRLYRSYKKFFVKVAACNDAMEVEVGKANMVPLDEEDEEHALLQAILAGQLKGYVNLHESHLFNLIHWFERADEEGTKTIQALVFHVVHQEWQVHIFTECWVC